MPDEGRSQFVMKPARPSEAWTGHPREFENGKVGHPPSNFCASSDILWYPFRQPEHEDADCPYYVLSHIGRKIGVWDNRQMISCMVNLIPPR
jgi:hypothetical protein